jgi:hypothetical protein
VVRGPGGDWYAGGGGGDWYAGGDNNIYRHTEQGWERADAARADGSIPGLGRAVDADGYVPSHYVPSREVSDGLNAEYAARQRQMMSDQRFSGAWGQRGFSSFGGGRYAGVSGGGFHGGGGDGKAGPSTQDARRGWRRNRAPLSPSGLRVSASSVEIFRGRTVGSERGYPSNTNAMPISTSTTPGIAATLPLVPHRQRQHDGVTPHPADGFT